jgi:histone H2B
MAGGSEILTRSGRKALEEAEAKKVSEEAAAPAEEAGAAAKKVSKKAAGGKKPKASKAPKGDKDKKRRHRRVETWGSYTYKVLKQVHPTLGISTKAMSVCNAITNDLLQRIGAKASSLAQYCGRSTLSARDVQSAVRLVMATELAKHAVSEGTKAVTKFNS